MIETKNLVLREMTENDFAALFKVLGDTEIMCHYPYIFDEARVKNWIKRNLDRYRILGFGLWAVCLKETGEMIGDCGLTMQMINGQIKPEIGYHIRKDLQGNGYAKEAAIAVRDWAFENTPFQMIYSYMKKANVPSAKTAISYGCRFVEEFTDEQNELTSVYAISREEWNDKIHEDERIMKIEQKLKVLSKIAGLFNKGEIKWAVGASLLLYLKRYVETFNDIDLLICEEDASKAKDLMMEIGELQLLDGNQYRADHFYVFMVDGVEVDIMGSYFVMKDGAEHKISLEKDAVTEPMIIHGNAVPLDSVRAWRRHYDVMGRQNKVDLIDACETL